MFKLLYYSILTFFPSFENGFQKAHTNKENSLIGELQGEDRGVVVLILFS